MQRRFSTWVFWSIYSKTTAIATASGQDRFKPAVFKGLRIGKSKIADLTRVFGKPADDYDDKRGTIWMRYKDIGPAPVWWRSQWTRGASWFGMSLFIRRISRWQPPRHCSDPTSELSATCLSFLHVLTLHAENLLKPASMCLGGPVSLCFSFELNGS